MRRSAKQGVKSLYAYARLYEFPKWGSNLRLTRYAKRNQSWFCLCVPTRRWTRVPDWLCWISIKMRISVTPPPISQCRPKNWRIPSRVPVFCVQILNTGLMDTRMIFRLFWSSQQDNQSRCFCDGGVRNLQQTKSWRLLAASGTSVCIFSRHREELHFVVGQMTQLCEWKPAHLRSSAGPTCLVFSMNTKHQNPAISSRLTSFRQLLQIWLGLPQSEMLPTSRFCQHFPDQVPQTLQCVTFRSYYDGKSSSLSFSGLRIINLISHQSASIFLPWGSVCGLLVRLTFVRCCSNPLKRALLCTSDKE